MSIDELLEQASDEADLCRNDGADDIAGLLDGMSATIRALREALSESVVGIDDWLHQYAADMCDQPSVDETRKRIAERGGTLFYIATLQKNNRAALEASQGREG